MRSLVGNPGTTNPCPVGTPAAFLSVNGGTTNLASYNNCNNGGDYGDFSTTGSNVQDAYSSGNTANSLSLTSPEVQLLDAVGYNILSSPTLAVGAATPTTVASVSARQAGDGGPDDGEFEEVSVPEPASMTVLALGILGLGVARRRRTV